MNLNRPRIVRVAKWALRQEVDKDIAEGLRSQSCDLTNVVMLPEHAESFLRIFSISCSLYRGKERDPGAGHTLSI